MNKLIERLKHGDGQSWHVSRATLDQAIKALEAADRMAETIRKTPYNLCMPDQLDSYDAYRNLTQEAI